MTHPVRRVTPALLTAMLVFFPTPVGSGQETNDAATPLPVATPLADNLSPREVVRQRASRSGWKGREWRCLEALVHLESRWNPKAANPNSSARGLFQMLKQKPNLPVEDQARLGLKYIKSRYGTPCKALRFHTANGWY